jgi:hypothetical protein
MAAYFLDRETPQESSAARASAAKRSSAISAIRQARFLCFLYFHPKSIRNFYGLFFSLWGAALKQFLPGRHRTRHGKASLSAALPVFRVSGVVCRAERPAGVRRRRFIFAEVNPMDILYLALTVFFFALTLALVYGCDKLGRPS